MWQLSIETGSIFGGVIINNLPSDGKLTGYTQGRTAPSNTGMVFGCMDIQISFLYFYLCIV